MSEVVSGMFSGIGSILMLHRTTHYKKGRLISNENMKISPEELEGIIKRLKRQRVFLSLDEVVEIIRTGKKTKYKFTSITLDDGYKDNLIYGYPVFKAHSIPFCIYITNSFPNRTTNLWWYALEDLILNNRTLRLPDGRKLENGSLFKKEKNFLKIRKDVIEQYFKDPIDYFQKLGQIAFDLSREREKKCLTWNEIKELSDDPLATIGCHTVNHYPLAKLDRDEAEFEIIASKKELESQLNKTIRHFAFPFGSKNEASQRDYEIASSVGFDSIVTARHGHVNLLDDPQLLNRIFLTPLPNDSSLFRRKIFWNLKSMVSEAKKYF